MTDGDAAPATTPAPTNAPADAAPELVAADATDPTRTESPEVERS